jgi:hypothetical protein
LLSLACILLSDVLHFQTYWIEQAQIDTSGPAAKVPLAGQPVLLMFTVHDHTAKDGDEFLGRVVLPQIRVGQNVDQWFVLQTLEGKELRGPSGKSSGLRVQIMYGRSGELERIGDPNITPYSLPVSVPIAEPSAEPSLPPPPAFGAEGNLGQEKDSWKRPSTPQILQAFAGTQFAFYVEVVEAKNLVMPGGGAIAAPHVCVSLLHDSQSVEQQHLLQIDHFLQDQESDERFLQFPPQHKSQSVPGGMHPMWNDSFTLKDAQPGIKTILDLKSRQQLSTSSQFVPLAGQTVLLLCTVHDQSPNGTVMCGRLVIPQVRSGQNVDQWFVLLDRDGRHVKNAQDEDATIRLRFAYGTVKEQNPDLPPGWERKTDETSGKTFYVNHDLKTFSWVPPPISGTSGRPAVPANLPKAPQSQHARSPPRSGPLSAPEVVAPPPYPGNMQPEPDATALKTSPPLHSITPHTAATGANASASGTPPQSHSMAPITHSQGNTHKVHVVVNAGKDLPRMDHLSLSNAYVCVSVIGDAEGIDEHTHARLQHDVSKNKLRAGLRSSALKFPPLHRTKTVNRSLNPAWQDSIDLVDGYLDIAAITLMQNKNTSAEVNRVPMKGTPVLVFITVHHEVSGAEDTAIGRFVVPVLRPGDELDGWHQLSTNSGNPLVGGMREQPAQLHVQIKYEAPIQTKYDHKTEGMQEQEHEQLQVKPQQDAQDAERVRLQHEQALQQQAIRQEQERIQAEQKAAEENAHVEAKRQELKEIEEAKQQREEQERLAAEAQRRIQDADIASRQRALEEQYRNQGGVPQALQDLATDQRSTLIKTQQIHPLPMQLKLGLDFTVVGSDGTSVRTAFVQNLTKDLSMASGLNATCFHVKHLMPGSVIADMQIHADPSGSGPNPRDVAANLEQQASDIDSPLRKGSLTCYLQGIAFPSLRPGSSVMTPLLSSDIAPNITEAAPTIVADEKMVLQKSPKLSPLSVVFPPTPSMHQAKLVVTVLQAKNLPPTDANCGRNAFCEIALENLGEEVPIARTATVLNSCDPVWDQHFVLGVDADQISTPSIKLSICDWNPKDSVQQNRVLGQVRKLYLADIVTQGKSQVWLDVLNNNGFPLINTKGQTAICLDLEYEAPFVRASVDSSPHLLPNALLLSSQDGLRNGLPQMLQSKATKSSSSPSSPQRGPNIGEPASQLLSYPTSPTNSNVRGGGVGMVLSMGKSSELVVDSLVEVSCVFFPPPP